MRDDKIEASPERRIGNPRPLGQSGRLLPVLSDNGNGVVSDVRTRIQVGKKYDAASTPTYGAALTPKTIKNVDGAWKVVFFPAKLWEHSLHNAGKAHDIGNLSDDPSPEHDLSVGDNEIWLTYTISSDGSVASAGFEIGGDPDTEPLKLDRPRGGSSSGNHKQKVGTITISEETGPVWKPECTSTVVHIFAPAIEDTGDGESVFNTSTGTVDKWRTLKNAESDGFEIVVGDSGDTIQFRRLENMEADYGEDIIDSQTDSAIRFRKIAQREGSAQVQVEVGTGNLTIKGNNIDKDVTVTGGGNLSFQDGLFVSGTSSTALASASMTINDHFAGVSHSFVFFQGGLMAYDQSNIGI